MSTVTADDGVQFDPEACATKIDYNGDGSVNYMECWHAGKWYRQSFTYANGKLIAIGRWVKQ